MRGDCKHKGLSGCQRYCLDCALAPDNTGATGDCTGCAWAERFRWRAGLARGQAVPGGHNRCWRPGGHCSPAVAGGRAGECRVLRPGDLLAARRPAHA